MTIPLGFWHGQMGRIALKKTITQLEQEISELDAFHEKDTNLCWYNQFAYHVHRSILVSVVKHKS